MDRLTWIACGALLFAALGMAAAVGAFPAENPMGDLQAGGSDTQYADRDMDGYDLICDTDGDSAITNDRDAGIGDDEIGVTLNSGLDVIFKANDVELQAGTVLSGASASSIDLGTNDQLKLCDSAGTSCVTLDFSGNSILSIKDSAGTGSGALFVTGNVYTDGILYFDSGGLARYGGFVKSADNGLYLNTGTNGYSNHNIVIGVDYSKDTDHDVDSVIPTIFLHDATDATTDNGHFMKWDHMGFYLGNPETDRAANAFTITSGNAGDLATGGNQTAGGLSLAAGIRTLQIVCTDRTVTDTDTVVFTIDGSATTLTESTDFDCEGEASEEVCCDNLGAAITTAAIGVTPDCATTAGTCSLEVDVDVLYVDGVVFADGLADGVGMTLTEGTDGDITMGNRVVNRVHTFTIADDGAGTHATATLTPMTNFVLCDCDDAHGCTVTMGETAMTSGLPVIIVGETASHCDFADTDGVSNLTGAFQMDDDDTLTIGYAVDEWLELYRSDN